LAHFILEYSANLSKKELRLETLFSALHDTVVDTGLFPSPGIRCRAHRCKDYRVANGKPDNAFIHINFRLGPGRSEDDQQAAFNKLKDTITGHYQTVSESRPLALSFEMSELPEKLRFNMNNLRDYMS